MPNKEPSTQFGLKATTIEKIVSVLAQHPEGQLPQWLRY
jgi:hypothetical protein